jgi:hypothetical protein
VREAGGGNAPVSITVMVTPWASAGKPSASALPAPEPVDHEEAAHGDMKTRPTPTLSDRDRKQQRHGHGSRHYLHRDETEQTWSGNTIRLDPSEREESPMRPILSNLGNPTTQ